MRKFAVPLASLLLAACFSNDRVAGGDDYPNSVEPLARHTAQETRDTSEWNAYRDAPAGAPGVYDSTRVPQDPPQSNPAGKRGVASPSSIPGIEISLGTEISGAARSVTTMLDAVTGLTRAVRVQLLGGEAGFRSEDTTWYKPDSAGPRVVRVSGYVTSGGRTRWSVFEDDDGDGFLSARAGAQGIARIRLTTMSSSGREEQEMRVGAGPDRDFGTFADNPLLALSRTTLQGLDTLLSLLLSDADGDGFIFNPLRDSNQVRVQSRVAGPGTRTDLDYRVRIFADSSRNHPYRYSRTVTNAAGVETTRALGRDSMPDFAPGDTGWVQVSFVAARAGDTPASAESRYRVALSDTAGRARGHKLLSVERDQVFGAGIVSRFHYRLEPAAPVADGTFARTGSVRARADLAAGGWIEFSGQAGADEISGTVMDSTGKSGTVTFGTNGEVKAASGF